MMQESIARRRAALTAADLSSAAVLEEFRLSYLGRKGQLADLFDELKTVPADERRAVGQQLNELKQQAQARYDEARLALETSAAPATEAAFDYTLPPVPNQLGTRHPLMLVREEMLRVFARIGFNVQEGPEIEDDWHNFTALNFPENHPARDMQDTFFLRNGEMVISEIVSKNTVDKEQAEQQAHHLTTSPSHLLRTHTSNVQVRVMQTQPPPIRCVVPGRVFRNEAISARAHMMFHQVEGLFVDEGVSFADLKQTIYYFVQEMFGDRVQVRFRPSFFPFTEPSAEVDITCLICQGAGCNVCKYSGWVEIMGCGMVDPAVLENCGIDPEKYSGYAWGMGIERIAMLKYQIKDLRLFTENDLRFLRQFESA